MAAKQQIDEDAKENLSDAELKAAKDNPPGDTESSGAAPGAKAGAADEPGRLDEPKSAVKAREDAEDEADEVREIQLATQVKNWTNVRAGFVETVYADAPEKGDPEFLVFAQDGSSMTVTPSTSKPLRFSRESALALQRVATHIGTSL